MKQSKNAIIKLGKIKQGSKRIQRQKRDSRQILDQFLPRSQRVVVKVKQSYNNAPGSWSAHGRYIERDSARVGDGFSGTEDSVRVEPLLRSWQESGDEKLHKIILSPEYSQRIDLKAHTKEVMNNMQAELGRAIEWAAVIHKNTDNPHVHISLRGMDENGNSLDIEEYLGQALRERSQVLVTKELGPRLFSDILQKREVELFSERLTDTDRALLYKADEHNIISIPQKACQYWQRNKTREQQRIRLTFLCGLGLSEQISEKSWRLAPELRDALQRLGLREQLVREQVPGWEFVRTLRRCGVERKSLRVGESITGRVVGVNIRDPFGDRRFMLLEATDGITYHINQPRGIDKENVKADDVVTLTRRSVLIPQTRGKESEQRQFTSVQVHADWTKSLVFDYEAVANLSSEDVFRESERIGFAKLWHEAVKQRIKTLRANGLVSAGANLNQRLEAFRFSEADSNATKWNPLEYANVCDTKTEIAAGRIVIGEILSTSKEKLLIKDLRDGVGRIVSLTAVSLSWAPSVGSTVVVEAKRLPHMELRPSDERIAELLSNSESFDEQKLNDKEKRFILSRANTWVRWKVLEKDEHGSYQLQEPLANKASILSLMEETLEKARQSLTEEIKKQPAWLKELREDSITVSSESFVTLDELIKKLGDVSHTSGGNWLSVALRKRQALWQERGVAVDENFEKNARAWLNTGLAPTYLKLGESVSGKILQLTISDSEYFSIDCSDGRVRQFRLTERIKEMISNQTVSVGDIVTLRVSSFENKKDKGFNKIHYLDVVQYADWKTSEEILRDALADRCRGEVEENSFASKWQKMVRALRDSHKALIGKELADTRLLESEKLSGKILSASINDSTKLLILGDDAKLHLVYQSNKIKQALKRGELKVGGSIRLCVRIAEISGRKVLYTDVVSKAHSRKLREEADKDRTLQFSELAPGKPLTGTITDIRFRADSTVPRYIVLRTADDTKHYITASRGISRLVGEGIVQKGDQVTLSLRQYSKNGELRYYTEVQHHGVRERRLEDREAVFGKLLSADFYKERYLLLDSQNGKIHLHVSRKIKNQIKSKSINAGDVLHFTADSKTRESEQDKDPVLTLRARVLRSWRKTEQFDREVIRYFQTHSLEDRPEEARSGFPAEWYEALRARGQVLRSAGILFLENPEPELKRFREQELYDERKRQERPRIVSKRDHIYEALLSPKTEHQHEKAHEE